MAETGKAPWRRVVKAYRIGKGFSKQAAVNDLECGHSLTFHGSKVDDALLAKRRRCICCQMADTTEE